MMFDEVGALAERVCRGSATVFFKYLKIVSFAPAEGEVSEKMRGVGEKESERGGECQGRT